MIYSILNSNYFVILFYTIIILLVILNRKKFVWQGIVGIRQTKKGLKKIDNIGKKYRRSIKIIARIGTFFAIIGVVVMTLYLVNGVITILRNPEAPPTVTPLLPGVKIPGTNIRFPLVESFIGIIIAVIVHEFAHGIVARSHGLKAKSTGIAFIGPLPAAFVELDEKKVEKEKKIKQIDIFAAGPWSNIILALLLFIILFLFAYIMAPLMPPNGFNIVGIEKNSPAANSSIEVGDHYFSINNRSVLSKSDFYETLINITPGEIIELRGVDKEGKNKSVLIKTGNRSGHAYMGVLISFEYKNENKWWAAIYMFFSSILYWSAIISLGLGLANLLPIGIMDGGRIIKTLTSGLKKGKYIYTTISWITLILLVINLLLPIVV